MITSEEMDQIKEAYRVGLRLSPFCEPNLAGVIRDTLASPGNLTRAQLIFRFLNNFKSGTAIALDTAIAVEYFHTASLLLDDLPCMDDAYQRRGVTCPHLRYGESATILGALAFVNRAYALIWSSLEDLPSSRRKKATLLLEECLGVLGVLNGQSLDLHFTSGPQTAEHVALIASQKTGSLIRLALVLPGIMMGMGSHDIGLLEELSITWGLAYQVLDDLKDLYDLHANKTAGRDAVQGRPNMALCLGVEKANAQIYQCLETCDHLIHQLGKVCLANRCLCNLQGKLRVEHSRLLSLAQAA